MYDLIIIGAGPAGLTAGLYAGRFRLNTLMLERLLRGGQIILSQSIENFPGFPSGVSTQELMSRIQKQVDDLGIKLQMEEVIEIMPQPELKTPIYNVKTKDNSYLSRSIILAVGAEAKRLNVQGEERLIGRGVSYCGTCDGPLFRDKRIVVVGGGDRAIEEAIFLVNYAKTVTIVHRRDQLRAPRILVEKAQRNDKINFIFESVLDEIIGKDKVESVKIRNQKTDSVNLLSCQGVFIFVGIKPNTDFVKNLLSHDESGFIITDDEMKTNIEGIFACGDCRSKSLYQVITACAEGAIASNSVHKYLQR